MKIINFEEVKTKINKLDSMANVDMTRPNSVFPQKEDDKMHKFFENFWGVVDGKNNNDWNI